MAHHADDARGDARRRSVPERAAGVALGRDRPVTRKATVQQCAICQATFARRNRQPCCGPVCGAYYSHRDRALVPLPDRLWRKVRVVPDGCWLWDGTVNNKGYGTISLGPRTAARHLLVHRVSWFLHTGEWPTLNVLHHCDTPRCVRPDHLFEGTQRDNMLDASAKGRIGGRRALSD